MFFTWNNEHYCLLYASIINTQILPLFLYYFVVPFALFCTMGCFMVLEDCQCIERCVVIFSGKKHNISKGKCDILKIFILLFDFLYFDVELLWHDSSYINSTEFISFSILCLRIFHNFKNQEQTNFDLLSQRFFLCWFCPKR